jgi:hypothetical protein
MSDGEFTVWCSENNLVLHDGRTLRDPRCLPNVILLPLPKQPDLVPWLAIDLLNVSFDEPRETLVWIRDWRVPTDLILEIGLDQCDRLRKSFGVDAATEDKPALLFAPEELRAAVEFGMAPMLFVWDAYLFAPGGNHISLVSHEGFACVASNDSQAQSTLLGSLARWNARTEPIPQWA